MAEQPEPKRRPVIEALVALVIVCGLFMCLATAGLLFPFEIAFQLLVGWAAYLWRTLPQVGVDWPNLALAVILLAAFAFGVHRFGGWLRREVADRRGISAPAAEVTPVWRGRWTFTAAAGVVLLFVAGIAAVGVAHQIGWLISSDQPLLSSNWEVGRRSESKNNLKQIGLALHNYHDDERQFPPGMTLSDQLTPLHGWGTLLLPYVEQPFLYERIDLSRPWDDEVNREPLSEVVPVYRHYGFRDPERDHDGYAVMHYAANSRLLYPGSRTQLRDITDGTSQTILGGEAAGDFRPWGSPFNWRDPAGGLNASASGFGGPWRGGVTQLLFADGAISMLSPEIDPDVLKALATPDGGESVPADSY